MLAGPDPLVVLSVLHDDTQDNLLQDLSQHQCQTDSLALPWVLLLTLLDGCYIYQPQVNWDLPTRIADK